MHQIQLTVTEVRPDATLRWTDSSGSAHPFRSVGPLFTILQTGGLRTKPRGQGISPRRRADDTALARLETFSRSMISLR